MNAQSHCSRLLQKSIALVVLLLAAFPGVAQDTTGVGSVKGVLLSDPDRKPLPDARICVKLSEARCASTNADGRFTITGLRPGAYDLEILTSKGSAPLKANVEVRAGIELVLELTAPALGRVEQNIEVTAPAVEIPQEITSSGHLVSGEEVQKDPSALTDVARYIQTMPGVAFGGDDFRNDIVVRGGSPLENLYIVDNIEVPSLSHFSNFGSAGGAIGLTNSNLLSDVVFLTGGYPAPYSNRLSSVLQVTQREGSRERVKGQMTVSFGGAGLIAEGPMTKKGSWLVSFRRSFLDAVSMESEGGGTPVYYNFQTKAVYDLGANDRVWFVGLGGWDSLKERPDPTKEANETEVTSVDWKGFRGAQGLNWQHLFGARGTGLLGLTFSRGRVKNIDRDVRLGNALIGRQDSVEDEYAVKYDLVLDVPLLQKLQLGGNARWQRSDYQFDTPLGVENPFSPAPGRVDSISMRSSNTLPQPSAYLQLTRSLGRRLSVTAGGRYDRYTVLDKDRYSGRGGFSYRLFPRLSFHASYGAYYQQPFLLYVRANPINRRLDPMRAEHYVAGFTYNQPSLLATLEAYQKDYSRYPVSLEYPQVSLAGAGDTYDPAEYMIPFVSKGKGRARGVELYARKTLTNRLYAQGSFAVARSQYSALDGILRPSGYDSRYVLSMTGGYRLPRNWEIAARYVFLSGRPYTPFDVALSQEQRRPIYDLARVNALRSPAYHRLDFRVDRTFKLRNGFMNVYGGLQNAFNRENYFGYSWNYRLNQPKHAKLTGIFPLCGLEWRF